MGDVITRKAQFICCNRKFYFDIGVRNENKLTFPHQSKAHLKSFGV